MSSINDKKRVLSQRQLHQLMSAFDQLAQLLNNGLSVRSALLVLTTQPTKRAVKKILWSLFDGVEQGLPLHVAIQQAPVQIPNSISGYLAIAEASGNLPEVITNMTQEFTLTASLRQQVLKALRYPVIIILVATLVTAILLLWVLPQFASFFGEQQLPQLTRLLLTVSTQLSSHPMLVMSAVGLPILAALGLRYWSPKRWQQLLLSLPYLGGFCNELRLQQLCQRLSLLLNAGLPAVNALQQVRESSSWLLSQQQLTRVECAITQGNGWLASFRDSGLNQSILLAYLSIGEQSGQIDTMLQRLAQDYYQRISSRCESLVALIEPLLMVILGGIIGTLLIAMYLPIFSMGQHVS